MGELGKFFFIRSQLNELVLEVKDGVAAAGQPVVTGRSHGGDNQLWYEDSMNECIRSKLDDNLCLEISGNTLIVSNFEPDEDQQRWKCHSERILHTKEEDVVLDVADCCEDPGARICRAESAGGANQLWSFEYVPKKYCYIVSKMHGYVMDVKEGSMDAGAKVLTWKRKDADNDNQMFWEDKYGYIHSKLNGYVFDSAEGSLRLQPYDPTLDSRKWMKCGQKIVNKSDPSTVVDIKSSSKSKGAKLVGWEYNAGDNQHWSFEYVN